jgi:predicted  nucleic acid-binding Zn-ribbon protein
MLKKDWKKEVWQLHVAFHETVLEVLERLIQALKSEEAILKDKAKLLAEELDKTTTQAHNLFDTIVAWVEQMNDQLLKLEGALEEARRRV